MSLRIKNGHYYWIDECILRNSNKPDSAEKVVSAQMAKTYRLNVLREYLATGIGSFKLHDGHLPEHQPIVPEVDMLRWLDQNPFGIASKVS